LTHKAKVSTKTAQQKLIRSAVFIFDDAERLS
jgi:hypothetical protein